MALKMEISFFIILIALYVASCSNVAANNSNSTILKEWMFEFHLLNESVWDNYEISKQYDGQRLLTRLKGESFDCTPSIPVISKKLCIDWNNHDGFKLTFKSLENLNVDPKYNDLLWYYTSKNTPTKVEKETKGTYDELNGKQLRFNVDGDWTKTSSLNINGDTKCYWSDGWRLCAHIHPLNANLFTVFVAANKENVRRLIGDYINDEWVNYILDQNGYNEYNNYYQDLHDHSRSSDKNNNNNMHSSLKTLKKLEHELSLRRIRMDLTQKSATGPPLLPGIYFMNKAYNALNGQPIYEQFGVDIIDYTFHKDRYTNDISGETYEIPWEFRSIPNIAPSCDIRSKVNSIHYSSSSAVLDEQAESVRGGFEANIDATGSFGAKVDGADLKGSVETHLRYAAMFGHSSTSRSGRKKASQGYTRSFSIKAKNTFYKAEMDWGLYGRNSDSQFKWKEPFLYSLGELNNNPTNKRIMQFIKNWGTHVLQKMETGSFCKETAYMSSSAKQSEMTNFHQKVNSQSFAYGFWKLDHKKTTSHQSQQQNQHQSSHQFGDIKCIGEVKVTGTACAALTSKSNNPIVTSYQLLKIWHIPDIIAILKKSTIHKIDSFVKSLFTTLKVCSKENCHDKGACTLRSDIWTGEFIHKWNGVNFRALWNKKDNEYCFCQDGLFGKDCHKCRCKGDKDCCCNDNLTCNGNLICSPKDNICYAQDGATQCGIKGQFIECDTQSGVVYGTCGSGIDGDCGNAKIPGGGQCAGNSFTGLYCGYAKLGIWKSASQKWRCNEKTPDTVTCVGDQFGHPGDPHGHHLMVGICGSGDAADCRDKCVGGAGIKCASIDGIDVNKADCYWEAGPGGNNVGIFLKCKHGYVGTGFCESGGHHVCPIAVGRFRRGGTTNVATALQCCKFYYPTKK